MEIYIALVFAVASMVVFILAAFVAKLADVFINFWTSDE